MASSSQTGLMALPWDVLVLNAFLLVSTGKPNMSISTYVPTFLSDRNWPEMIWKEGSRARQKGKKKKKIKHRERDRDMSFTDTKKTNTHLYRQRVGDYPVHCALSEGVEVFVRPPHELWFESVATFPVVFIHAQVQLHGQVCGGRTDEEKFHLNESTTPKSNRHTQTNTHLIIQIFIYQFTYSFS